MKKLLIFTMMMIGFLTVGFSQVKKKGVQTVTISTPAVLCETCKDRIEKFMIREEGVQKVSVDFKHGKTKVTYVAERTNVDNIKTAIANLGYDADDITANEESYAQLPSCCKRPEDGGDKKK